MGRALMENRHGLVVDGRVSVCTGTAKRDEARGTVAALPGRHRITLGADKHFDERGFVADMREPNVTPHVAQNTSGRRPAIDGRTNHPRGYALPTGDEADRGGVRLDRGGDSGTAAPHPALRPCSDRLKLTLAAAYDLIRLPKLLGAGA